MIKNKTNRIYTPSTVMSVPKILLCMLLMLVVFGVLYAREIFVDDDSEALEPDGSELFPFPVVKDAIIC